LAAAAGGTVSEAVRAHLEHCNDCRAFAEDCSALADRVRTARGSEPEFDETDALRLAKTARSNVEEGRGEEWTRSPWWAMPAFSASLGTTLVILVVGLGVFEPSKPGPAESAAKPAETVRPQIDAGVKKTSAPAAQPATQDFLSRLVTAPNGFSAQAAVPVDLATISRYVRTNMSDMSQPAKPSGSSAKKPDTKAGGPGKTGRTEQQ
jgi:hypothetical protein